MKKLAGIVVAILVVVAGIQVANAGIYVFDSWDLDAEILENRDGNIIIERCIGFCLDYQGNGVVFNGDSYYNYISYRGIATKGDLVVTWLVYDWRNNYVDDIYYRYDYIVGNMYRWDRRFVNWIGK